MKHMRPRFIDSALRGNPCPAINENCHQLSPPSLFCLCTLLTYIVININPDQTASLEAV